MLAVALVANVLLYALVVYPLAGSVADDRGRATKAEQTRRLAQRDFNAAKGLAAGSEKAAEDLQAFYDKVLPANVSAAHRATYLTVAQMARKANLRLTRRGAQEEKGKEKRLDRFTWDVVLQGNYEDIRRFLYELETSTAFVVIDSVSLGQGREAGSPLEVNLRLSTYYRAQADAS